MNQPIGPQYNANQKPGLVTAVAVMTLVSGILNILWGVIFALTLLVTVVGILCMPLAIYPIVLGILELIYSLKLLPDHPAPVRPATYIAVMEIINIVVGSLPSLVIGILSLIFYNDPKVQSYFASLNGQGQQPQYLAPGTP